MDATKCFVWSKACCILSLADLFQSTEIKSRAVYSPLLDSLIINTAGTGKSGMEMSDVKRCDLFPSPSLVLIFFFADSEI